MKEFPLQCNGIYTVKGAARDMEFEPIHLDNKHPLIVDYHHKPEFVKRYFHYLPFGEDEARLADMKTRNYKREALSNVLLPMNKAWGAPAETLKQIDRLKLPESMVVIGGQQAGLLTGPLYTVNKMISIIRLAREKETNLEKPVIPVFWIAGEDHDFAEINHVFSIYGNKNSKHTIKQHEVTGKSISDIKIDQHAARKWLQQFLNDLPETDFTATWFEETIHCLQASVTFTDFFARLIYQLFPDEGVVLVDAHDRTLRQLESEYFMEMIQHQETITRHVYNDLQHLQQNGYPISLDMEKQNANLFFHSEQGARVLLERNGNQWIGKNDEILLTTEELVNIAKEKPWCLSTNVVTRPMMQELLFPTIAFVAGDGEISYWATLKNAFEAMGIKVPPVVPRLSFTYVTERTVKLLEKRVLRAEEVVKNGTRAVKQKWLLSQQSVPLDAIFTQTKEGIEDIHAPLREYAASISPDLGNEAAKNYHYIEQQIDYLKKRMLQKMQENYQVPLSHFDELDNILRPNGGLQERIWNPYILINQYGKGFLKSLLDEDHLPFDHPHYLVYVNE